jgi:hypothetical protein
MSTPFEGAADLHGGGGAQRPGFQRLKALVQRGAVAQGFLGGRVGVVVALRILEQLVGRGDDVFDFRAVFGFQQRDGVDQHRLVGDELGGLLELGQRARASMQALSTARLSSSRAGGSAGRWLWGCSGCQAKAAVGHDAKILFYRHVNSLCRR